MYRTINAKFVNGVLVPLEELRLSEGQEVRISLDDKPLLTAEEKLERLKSSAGAWKGKIDGDALIRQIYEDRRRGLPPLEDE